MNVQMIRDEMDRGVEVISFDMLNPTGPFLEIWLSASGKNLIGAGEK